MVLVMVLCPSPSLRGQYWPFNLDQSGRPKLTRHQIGSGVHCHQGLHKLGASGPVFQTETETFLVWKRHHVFGGSEVLSLVVTAGSRGDRDARMSSSLSDPNFWSYGIESVNENITTPDNGRDFGLHFYFSDYESTDNSEWTYERVDVSLRGHWFDIMRSTGMLLFLLDAIQPRQLSDQNPSSPSQTHHFIPPPVPDSVDRSRSRHEFGTAGTLINRSSTDARRGLTNSNDSFKARANITGRGVSSHRHSNYSDTTIYDTHNSFGFQSPKLQHSIARTNFRPSGLINSSYRVSSASHSPSQSLDQTRAPVTTTTRCRVLRC